MDENKKTLPEAPEKHRIVATNSLLSSKYDSQQYLDALVAKIRERKALEVHPSIEGEEIGISDHVVRFTSEVISLAGLDSVKKCPHCNMTRHRRWYMAGPYRINLEKPDLDIFEPRVSGTQLPVNAGFFRRLLTVNYKDPDGWWITWIVASCRNPKCRAYAANKLRWSEVPDRCGYRKICTIRWPWIWIRKCILWKSYEIHRVSGPEADRSHIVTLETPQSEFA